MPDPFSEKELSLVNQLRNEQYDYQSTIWGQMNVRPNNASIVWEVVVNHVTTYQTRVQKSGQVEAWLVSTSLQSTAVQRQV